jgi:hypothetical protein
MPTRKADARAYPTLTSAEAEAWRDLHRQLARTRTLQDAKDIAAQAAPPHAKRFYAHLRSFVRTAQIAATLAREASCTSMASSVSDLPTAVSPARNQPKNSVMHRENSKGAHYRSLIMTGEDKANMIR